MRPAILFTPATQKISYINCWVLMILSLICMTLHSQDHGGAKTTADSFFLDINKRRQVAIGKPFPNFSAEVEGMRMNMDSLKGEIVFINLWFEGCVPCIAEFEGLNELYQQLKDRRGFKFISFTFETPEKVKDLKEKYLLPYNVLSISHEEAQRMNQGLGFPTSLILDRKGIIKYISFGGSTDKKRATALIMGELYPEILSELGLNTNAQ